LRLVHVPLQRGQAHTVVSGVGGRILAAHDAGRACIALLLVFAPNLLQNLPTSALAAVVIAAAIGLFEFSDLKRIYRYALGALAQTKAITTQAVGSPDDMALESLGSFINNNLNHTLIINKGVEGAPAAPMNKATIQAPIRVRYEPDTREMIVPVSELRSFFVERRVDFKTAMNCFDRDRKSVV
jgi:hypothetical protein